MTSAPVLITGTHRSGTTWVGEMLTQGGDAVVVREPFRPTNQRSWLQRRPERWFEHVDAGDEARYVDDVRRLVELRYPWRLRLGRGLRAGSPREVAVAVRDGARIGRARRAGHTLVIKDPIAFFAADWLADRFGVRLVQLLRHPGAFAGSLKRLGWELDFANLADQADLLAALPPGFADAVRSAAAEPPDVIDSAILQWRLVTAMSVARHERRGDGVLVRYEDLALEPVDGLRGLYGQLGLPFTDAAAERIRSMNASEHGGDGHTSMQIRRDSVAATRTWRDRLTDDEIERVRIGTAPEADPWYADDWA